MSYYKDVYLKRMNKDGNTMQERILTRKELEFDKLFMKRTEYQCAICDVNGVDKKDLIASIQPSNWNQSKDLSNLLTSTKMEDFHTGDILRIFQKIKDREQLRYWLILDVDDNITRGYKRYTVIYLDREVIFTNEYGDTELVQPVKIIDASSKSVSDNFQFNDYYREPSDNRIFITRDNDYFQKDVYFKFKDKAYKITGINRDAIEGVAYVSIKQTLENFPEPRESEDIMVDDDTNFFLNNK